MVLSFPLKHVTNHVNQTPLVDHLLERGLLHHADFSWYEPDEDGDYPHIYQWLLFPYFKAWHYECLEIAKIPVIDYEIWTWVGITSFGMPYFADLYPSLIEAIFGQKAQSEYFLSRHQKTA